jgi:hypothetical protein
LITICSKYVDKFDLANQIMIAIMKHSTIERKPNIMADTFVQLHKALHINDNERTVIILLALRENIIEMKAKDQTIFQKACHEIKNFNK